MHACALLLMWQPSCSSQESKKKRGKGRGAAAAVGEDEDEEGAPLGEDQVRLCWAAGLDPTAPALCRRGCGSLAGAASRRGREWAGSARAHVRCRHICTLLATDSR